MNIYDNMFIRFSSRFKQKGALACLHYQDGRQTILRPRYTSEDLFNTSLKGEKEV